MPAPFSSAVAVVGGLPTKIPDIPVCAVFIALFAVIGAGHMTRFRLNNRRKHKFRFNVVLFAFCMARIATGAMRIAWALHPNNIGVLIAAEILVNAGVLILYIVNLVLAQRVLRAACPRLGWHPASNMSFIFLYTLIPLCLVAVITTLVQTINTTNINTLHTDRHVQMAAVAVILFLAFMPLPILLLSFILSPREPKYDFGYGSWRMKTGILLLGSALTCLDAGFRSGTALENARPATDPAWYDQRWCFYVFGFTMEVLVAGMYLIGRIDKRFWVPDGCKRPEDYHQLDWS